MYNGKYISIKQIASKIKRGKLYKDIPFDSVIDYAVEALRLIMSEKYFITKPALLVVEHNKTKLPCDFELMIQCSHYNCSTSTHTPMRYATDNYASVFHNTNSPDLTCQNEEYTYAINNGVITTNFQTGSIFVVYKGIHSDEEGLPMVPDNVNVKLALEYFIKYRYLDDIGTEEPMIERRRSSDEQMYCWYIGKAQSAATNMTMDEWESFGNSMSQMFIDPTQFSERLKNLGTQEFRKLK